MLTVTITEFLGDNFVMIYELAGLVILLLVGAHISSKMKRKTLVAIILLFAELFLLRGRTLDADISFLQCPPSDPHGYALFDLSDDHHRYAAHHFRQLEPETYSDHIDP